MNVFSPYILLEDSPSKIQLKENNFRKNLRLLVLKFLPVVFLPTAIFLLLTTLSGVQNRFNIFMIIALIISTAFMLRRKTITEVLITKMSIAVTYNYFFVSRKQSFPIPFIDHIACKRSMRGGKVPVYVFLAIMKGDGIKHPLFKIRALYTNGEKRTIIKNKLETLTGLKVVFTRTKISSNNILRRQFKSNLFA